ncbi:MAG: trimethylamine methyltransferase family protein, partial [Thermoplasmata archaeon]
MARGRLSILFPEEIERIHSISIRILEKIGIVVKSENVSKMLLDAGAIRSPDGKRILIPERMVKAALASVPKSILLAGRNGAKDMTIPSNRLYAATGGEGVYIKDLVKGTTRPTSIQDLRDVSRIVESLPQIDFLWGLVGALDVPDLLKTTMETKTALQYCSKHWQGGSLSAEEAKRDIDLAAIVVGGQKELAKRPIISAVECPLSPLTFEKGLVEAQVTYARAGIPVVAMVANMAGLTSPITLSGTVTQTNAENLASLVISQTAKPGSPWIYSSDSVPADLRTGSIDYGAFEAPLMRAAAGEMGRHYGFPVMCAGLGIEETSMSLSSIREGVPFMLNEALVQSDLGSGFGGIDQAAGAAFEQIIVDAWIWEIAREIAREFDTDEDAIAFDTIREASEDMNFLTKRHTMARFRKESLATS